MDLKEYIFREEITMVELARKLDIHPSYLREIRKKKKVPSYKLALKIEVTTGGKVTIEELRGTREKK